MTVTWRDGVRTAGIRPEEAVAVFGRLASEGGLTTEAVVAEAEPPESPLHPAFEWNDAQAGHLYRLDQARHLIRALVITPDDGEPVPVYVHVSDYNRYEETVVLALDPDRWRLAYEDARRDLASAARKIRALDALAADSKQRKVIKQTLWAVKKAADTLEAAMA